MTVVSNASPLIILYNCGMLGLLQQLFGHIFIPEAVHHEVVHNAKDHQQSVAITGCDFISVRPIATPNFAFSHKLGRGEQEAIILASEIKADYLLLDDKRAQKEAKEQQITFIPTFALLVKAVQKTLIPELDTILTTLAKRNIFLNRELNLAVQDFLDRA
jgi:predicted nucleic acid-binding protein